MALRDQVFKEFQRYSKYAQQICLPSAVNAFDALVIAFSYDQ